ncbi:hypothetical protein [Trinickia sp. EG282A]|uniref:hypothetical protein n=1 Tax=Trinickia sp. EG282A TaxID=3237013 RepID=UPI0034D334DC
MRAVDFVRALREAYDLGAEAVPKGLQPEGFEGDYHAHQKQAAIEHLIRKYTVIEGYVAKYEARHDVR